MEPARAVAVTCRTAVVALTVALSTGTVSAAALPLCSGRGETLVAPIIAAFEAETGSRVNVRCAGAAELAVLPQEEGANSPADVC